MFESCKFPESMSRAFCHVMESELSKDSSHSTSCRLKLLLLVKSGMIMKSVATPNILLCRACFWHGAQIYIRKYLKL